MADNLLPCPFCGGEARVWMPEYPLNVDCGDATVSCSNCDADGPAIGLDMDVHTLADWPDLEAEAIAAWNRRAVPETGFLGHLVVPKSGVGAVFIGKGEPVPLMGDKGRVVPVYDGPQNVTANDPMEAMAWREKVAMVIEDNVEAERRGPGDGWLEVVGIYDAADAILALIATHPEPGA